ncbi:hypothetical protein U1Q18_002076 [Sarracenia purpurea var. burkii]
MAAIQRQRFDGAMMVGWRCCGGAVLACVGGGNVTKAVPAKGSSNGGRYCVSDRREEGRNKKVLGCF